jgi:tetratricopeptide (TPR) repeat protein
MDDISDFEILRNTNYHLPYINEHGDIKKYNSAIFHLSENSIRNMKRAAAAISLFCGENAKTLIIDSNQKFFKNPLFGFFTNAVVIDNVPYEYIRYNKLPVSGRELYITEEKEALTYIINKDNQYNSIIDAPNILDQNFHPFRFSKDYYALIKKYLSAEGVYIKIINLQLSNYDLISDALSNLSEIFSRHYVFIFSDIAMIISSDSINNLRINKESIERINKIIDNNKIYGLLFYNDTHPFNYLAFNDLKIFKELLETQDKINPHIYREVKLKEIPAKLKEFCFSHKDPLFVDDNENKTASAIKYSLERNASILNLLKEAEYAESINEYEQETSLLSQLKKYAVYNSELRKYIELVLDYKKNYYYNEALRLEKLNRWEEAIIIYKAMLIIDSNNFDTNYKLGLLYLTIQELDNSFKYLDMALKLNRNHPQALYQMGILLFSSDKFKESIDYLVKAKGLGINTSTLYLYIGISYERIGSLERAKENIEKAILLDPADKKLKDILEQLKQRVAIEFNPWNNDDKTNMVEDEQGEEIRLPVIKRALNSRLKEENE